MSTLTISAGANGTVNTGVNEDYALNATPTITATPNANYAFSNWSSNTTVYRGDLDKAIGFSVRCLKN